MPRKRSHPPKDSAPAHQPRELGDTIASLVHEDGVAARNPLPFPVVGVGASAGGLEAFTQMLKALPVDTGMAFVLVQHLSPSRSSMLSEILGRATKMPVNTVEDGMEVEPNRVYVIPPGTSMELAQRQLSLSPRQKADASYRPVDQFLRSLATQQGHQSIGVILSGTATDGTLGCEEIKAEGGITFAQDSTAQQDSMPRSAMAAGCVDFVLPPDEIAKEIARIARHPMVRMPGEDQPPEAERLSGIIELIRAGTGVDFTHYKHNTLFRRVTRRMVLHKVDDLKDYQRLVASTPSEVEALFQDILISVTSFFRNPDAFEVLKQKVFPELVKDRSRHLPIRIWVLGCSTGEEAYSLAMAFTEFASSTGRAIPVQMFASDLNGIGIEKARAGVYSKAIERDVSPDRLRRFFVESNGSYRVVKSIRDMVVFARHNALTDPPFSHIDLISCRNLLIYLDPVLQQRMIPIMHYGLQNAGFLWLGASETIGAFRNLFELIDAKHKVYQRKPAPPQVPRFGHPEHRVLPRSTEHALEERPAREPVLAGGDPQREADRQLLSRYAPAGVLINADLEILQFRGETGPYLNPVQGRASLNLLKMLRDGLTVGVRAAVLKAKREGRPVRQEDLRIPSDSGPRAVSVEVIPILSNSGREAHYMVVFDDAASARARAKPSALPPRRKPIGAERAETEITRLKQELAASREYLQSVIEQQEASNEELQSANEEVQSANEELQSINEELETSKEEIQSSSEELATVNDELNNRNQELSQSHNDLTNLIASIQMPIVMVGPDLRIRRFTPTAEKLLNLIAADVGRPIGDIKLNFEIPDLENMLLEIMDTVNPRELVVRDKRGRWYALRLRPYRTVDNKIDGVVMALVDIDSLKLAEEKIQHSADRLMVLQEQAPVGIRETDPEGRYTYVNGRYCAITGYSRDELIGRRFIELLVPEDRNRAQELWKQVLSGEIDSYRDERRYLHKSGQLFWAEVNGFAIRDANRKPVRGVAFVQDISERKQVDAELRAADRSKNEFLAMLAHELRNPLAPLLNVVELLGMEQPTPEKMASLREILDRQIRNLSHMTDDLLDVSRVSQGKMRLHRDVVELGAIARRAVELFRPTIEGRGQRFSVELPDLPVYLDADAVRVEQIFDNLLTNASKYADATGQIWLSVQALDVGDGNPMVEIRVRDDGSGIPPELLPRIFDPFTQGDHSLDRSRGGLGIGLTLVKSLVELHGGTIEARSDGPGKGAEFVVRLPVTSAKPQPPKKPDGAKRQTPARKVLVVDDNVDGAETLALLLRSSGYEVSVTVDGGTAVENAIQFRPDVVLLDIGLPGKDGFEVARELRGRPETNQVVLVAVSGYGQDEDRRRAREAGIDHYITKPMDLEALEHLLSGSPPPGIRWPRILSSGSDAG